MNLKNIILGIGILILTIAVGIYGINTFYNSPDYNDYCQEAEMNWYVNNSVQCESVGGKWNEYYNEPKLANNPTGYCDTAYNCRMEFDSASETYSRAVFLISIPLGVLIIAFGVILFGLEPVGAGLMAGGVGIILWGVSGFWNFAEDWIKFLLSIIGLIALIWLAYFINGKISLKLRRSRKK